MHRRSVPFHPLPALLVLLSLPVLPVLTATPLAAAPFLLATRPAGASAVLVDLAGIEWPREIAAGSLPSGVAAQSASGRWAVADASAGIVRLFAPGAVAPLDLPAGPGAAGLAFCGTARLALAATQGDRIDLFAPESGASLGSVAVGAQPLTLACDATRAVVTAYGEDRVWIVDLAAGTATQVAVGAFPAGVALVGDRAWVANFGDDTVSVVDLPGATVIATLPVAGGPRGVAQGGGRVFVAAWNTPTIAVFDAASAALVATWNLAAGPAFDLFYAESGRLYATHPAGNELSVLDTTNGLLVAAPAVPSGLALIGGVVPTGPQPPAIPTLPPGGLARLAGLLALAALVVLRGGRRGRAAGVRLVFFPLFLLFARTGSAADVAFTDSVFAVADWEVASASVGAGSHEVMQSPSIGHPAPSRWMSHDVAASPGGAESVEVVHRFLGGSFDPTGSGAVGSIDATWEHALLQADGVSSVAERFVVFQGGVAYRSAATSFSGATWQSASWSGLTAAALDDGSGGHPDFSATAAPLSFGYLRRTVGDSTAAGTAVHALDNFAVTVHTPAGVTLFARAERQYVLAGSGAIDLCAQREGDGVGPAGVELRISLDANSPDATVLQLGWADGELGVRCAAFTPPDGLPSARFVVQLANATPSPGAAIDATRARALLLYSSDPSFAGPLTLIALLLARFDPGSLAALALLAASTFLLRRASRNAAAAPASEA